MNTVVKIQPKDVGSIPYQEASFDIWDKKYRLTAKDGSPIDKSMDDTYKRVARALADVEGEPCREQWYESFLWALRHGAIPAGRVTSNAGALEHKPATSTINCTVSGTIRDSMDDILKKVHEAGLTLKAGCGIGYEFSTLRPRGAYVSGAGAYTSGPLSFMDIYDKMCFTVSSAGGRRGAQMGTFDIGHPDALEFIRAKRENGRLRQFNLSLLVTDEFMKAVKSDGEWTLAFPLGRQEYEAERPDLTDTAKFVWREWPYTEGYVANEEGLVACKIYKTLPARRVWDVIMTSTYDFAEPGFILIDKVNEMNNNWWTENVRATNPCVTADTRLATQFGMVRIGDLYNARVDIQATVDRRALGEGLGVEMRPAVPAFMTSSSADVYRVVTEDGYEIKATEWHDFYTSRGKIKLKDLKPGDELLIQSGKGQFGGCGSAELGQLLGLLAGDGHFTNRGKNMEAAVVNLWG
ncbi:MAG TPA: ribonucleotide reductase N-terminal alpha domain-containing protein, partial [Steroidobacteraceae bacterium]